MLIGYVKSISIAYVLYIILPVKPFIIYKVKTS